MEPLFVTVNLMGGLGNQMFQIAAAYAYSKGTGRCLRLLQNTSLNDVRLLYWDSILSRWSPYFVSSLPHDMASWNDIEPCLYTPIPESSSSGLQLRGSFQSSKYFGGHATRCEIREYMRATPDSILAKYAGLLQQRHRVVVVHARRTDYLRNDYIINFHGPLTVDYYQRAMERMATYVDSPIFLLCSDDNRFWTDNLAALPLLHRHTYQILEEESDVVTLALLQQFPNFILANSSFSWWAAWLAEAQHVIAPIRWFGPGGPKHYEDIYEDGWERM